MKCKLCGSSSTAEVFHGNIRDGMAGMLSRDSYSVIRCTECGVRYLDPVPVAEYASDEYRTKYNASASLETYYELHDPIALNYSNLLQGVPMRDKTICDVGCGGGTFLDSVKGIAANTIGIEPNDHYRKALEIKGHTVFASLDDAFAQLGIGTIDIVTSFHVIEHVPDPVSFVSQINRMKKKGGTAIILTPNADDILLQAGMAAFESFYYRTVHPWYFNKSSLTRIAEQARSDHYTVQYRHNFNFSNFYTWIKEGRPSGNDVVAPFNNYLDATWQTFLTANGHSDEIYIEIR